MDDIDTLGVEIDQLTTSSLSDDTMSALQSVFSSIADNVDIKVLGTVVEALKTFAAVSLVVARSEMLLKYVLIVCPPDRKHRRQGATDPVRSEIFTIAVSKPPQLTHRFNRC